MSKTFSGALSHKRKADLVEIAEALKLEEVEGKVGDLVKNIQHHLEANEVDLKDSPMFKGLYKGQRRAHTETEHETSPDDIVANATAVVTAVAKKSRKSVNKALDRVQETIVAAGIPLPESPVVNRIQEVADATVTQASQALVPAQKFSSDLTTRLQPYTSRVVSLSQQQLTRYENATKSLREYLSRPAHLVSSAIAIELLFLLIHVTQWYNHTVFFPPASSDKGTISSLLHAAFFWAPKVSYTIRAPESRGLLDGEVWSAVAWWFSTTVLPALAASSLITFSPKGTQRGPTTRSQSHTPVPFIDPLAFAFVRLALLILPLTSAAPSAMVDALEMSGNPQGRALGAGLTAALVLAYRLQG